MSDTRNFAIAVLNGLNITPNRQNVKALIGWATAEGGHTHNDARWNFLNTTQPMPGAGNTGSQGNIKVYRNFQQGVRATVRTLRNGHYGHIIGALAHGTARDVAAAIDASPWGTHGSLVYNAIAGASGGGSLNGPHVSPIAATGARTTTKYVPGKTTQNADAALIDTLLDPTSQGHLLQSAMTRLTSGAYDTTTPARTITTKQPGSQPSAKHAASGVPTNVSTSAKVITPNARWNPYHKPIAAWIVPILEWASQHGWHGTVSSGYRNPAQQLAAARGYGLGHYPNGPLASNHLHGGAVDVTDPAGLARVLRGYNGPRKLIWGGPVMGDQPHFSANGH